MNDRFVGQGGLLRARICDAARLARNSGYARFVGFLDEREAGETAKIVERDGMENTMLWGGHPGAERVFFGAFPDFMEPEAGEFPIEVLTVRFRAQDRLTHRDFLGALLHTGLERAAFGDILVESGRCVLFCRREAARFLCTQVEKIGGVGVRVSAGAEDPLPAAHHFAEFSGVVAAARLDCAVAAAVGTSREKAAGMIRSQQVELNHEPESSLSAPVREGDVLSVRGEGRFAVDRLGPVTKKGRLCIAGRKYI